MTQDPDSPSSSGELPDDTGNVTDSDPSGNTPEGLSGDMGISSERVGDLAGGGEGTHGAEATHPDLSDRTSDDEQPEQSADPATGEPQPDNDVPPHPFDPDHNPGHSGG